MTLVESLNTLTQLMTQLVQAQSQPAGGMTAEQAAQLNQASADIAMVRDQVAGIQSSVQSVIAAQATHAEALSAAGSRLTAVETDVATLKAGIGDLTQLGGA